jgi:predicted secreted protein
MLITDYHVQSVLRTYTKQLQRLLRDEAGDGGEKYRMPEERATISDEARRRLIRERVAVQALGHFAARGSMIREGSCAKGKGRCGRRPRGRRTPF